MPMPVLALLAVLASTPSLPLDGCTAEPTPKGWAYHCGELEADVKNYTDPVAPAQALDGIAATFTKKLGSTATMTRERRRLAGREVDSLRVVVAGSKSLAFVVQEQPEGARVVACSSERPARCDPVLEALASAGWREGPVGGAKAAAPLPLTLLGRPVRVPAKCTGEVRPDGAGSVGCQPMFMAVWSYGEDAVDARAAGFEDWAVEKVLKGKKGTSDAVPCRLQGAAARCRRVRVTSSPLGAAVVITASLVQDDKKLLAACITPGDTGASVPCSLILELP